MITITINTTGIISEGTRTHITIQKLQELYKIPIDSFLSDDGSKLMNYYDVDYHTTELSVVRDATEDDRSVMKIIQDLRSQK
jgi:hypothetical protein